MNLDLTIEDLMCLGGIAMKAAELLDQEGVTVAADEDADAPKMNEPVDPGKAARDLFMDEPEITPKGLVNAITGLAKVVDLEAKRRVEGLDEEVSRRARLDGRVTELALQVTELTKATAFVEHENHKTTMDAIRQLRRNERTLTLAIEKQNKRLVERLVELREEHPLAEAIERLAVRIFDLEQSQREDVREFMITRFNVRKRLNALEKKSGSISAGSAILSGVLSRLDKLEKGAPIREGTAAELAAIEKLGGTPMSSVELMVRLEELEEENRRLRDAKRPAIISNPPHEV